MNPLQQALLQLVNRHGIHAVVEALAGSCHNRAPRDDNAPWDAIGDVLDNAGEKIAHAYNKAVDLVIDEMLNEGESK